MTDDRKGQGEGRHPLPGSQEARKDEIPEPLIDAKGTGDDSVETVHGTDRLVGPDGETYGGDPERSSIEQVDDA